MTVDTSPVASARPATGPTEADLARIASGVGRFPTSRFWTYGLWAILICALGYFLIHTMSNEGPDFNDVYSGPDATLEGKSPYPTSSDPSEYFHAHRPYFIFPPGAPVLLSPFALLPRHRAWFAFSLLMVLLLPISLGAIVRRMRPDPPWLVPLVLLGVFLYLPYHDGLGLGNVDLLCAGVVLGGMAMLMDTSHQRLQIIGGALVGAALAVKPTLWPLALVVLLAVPMAPRIALIAGALVPTALGFLVVPGTDRYFTHVLPELSRGEGTVGSSREALGDLVRTTAAPDALITAVSLVLTAAATIAVVHVIARRRGRHARGPMRFAALGPVVPLALLLAPYGFLPYSIYLLVALPFVLVGAKPWMAIGAGVGAFAIGADVSLRYGGALDGLLQWRFLAGLAVVSLIAAAGLREWLNARPALGFSLNDAPAGDERLEAASGI